MKRLISMVFILCSCAGSNNVKKSDVVLKRSDNGRTAIFEASGFDSVFVNRGVVVTDSSVVVIVK